MIASTMIVYQFIVIKTAINGLGDGWLVVERTKTRLSKIPRPKPILDPAVILSRVTAIQFFRCDFFATWNLRPNLPAESKITKAFQTNFLLMCMSDTQTRTYQKSSDREALSSLSLTTKSYCCGAYLSANHSKSSSTPRGVG